MNVAKRIEDLELRLSAGPCPSCGHDPSADRPRCIVLYPGDLVPHNLAPCPECGASPTVIEVVYVDTINQAEALT